MHVSAFSSQPSALNLQLSAFSSQPLRLSLQLSAKRKRGEEKHAERAPTLVGPSQKIATFAIIKLKLDRFFDHIFVEMLAKYLIVSLFEGLRNQRVSGSKGLRNRGVQEPWGSGTMVASPRGVQEPRVSGTKGLKNQGASGTTRGSGTKGFRNQGAQKPEGFRK